MRAVFNLKNLSVCTLLNYGKIDRSYGSFFLVENLFIDFDSLA